MLNLDAGYHWHGAKPFVSLTIPTSPNLSPIVVLLEIFPSLTYAIPVPLRRIRTTRSSTNSHPFQVSLHTPRTLSHKSSFIPRTCHLWNVLPSSCFPESYNLPSFKSKTNKRDLIYLSSQPFTFFFLPFFWAWYRPPWPFPNITH